MNRKLLAALLVVVLVTPSVGLAASNPDLSATLANDTVTPGQETTLTVDVTNSPNVYSDSYDPSDPSTTARNVHLTMEDGNAPIEVKTATQTISAGGSSNMQTGTTLPATFDIEVADGVEPGDYRVPIHAEYDYTVGSGGVRDDKSREETLYVTLHVEDAPRFEVVDTATTAGVGDSGNTTLTLQNVGSEPANDAYVTVSPQGSQFVVNGGDPVTVAVGDWATGANRTVTVASSVAADAEAENYTVGVQASYENANGVRETGRSLTTAVTPLAEQTFAVSDVQSTLRVGEDGDLNATVTNDGPTTVTNAVVTLAASSSKVTPKRTEFAVGTLAPGDAADVSFPVEVTDSASDGPRQLQFAVNYWNPAGDARTSDDIPVDVDVAPERDQFVVTPVDSTLTAGGGRTVTFHLTNNGDTTVTNVDAKVYADSPISAGDDQAFVPSLAPGETKNVTVQLSASGSALAKTYPVKMDFQYDSDGETKLSDYYRVPLRVTEPSGQGGLPIVPIVVVVLLLVAAGGYYYYRRQ